jgi:hypothetical protein
MKKGMETPMQNLVSCHFTEYLPVITFETSSMTKCPHYNFLLTHCLYKTLMFAS